VVVGATKTLMTKKSPVLSALENLSIGVVGGILSFLVGQFFESFVG
jgi:VIT1/CCC1 family predicted Fe2+/Mn2+ transporter